MKEKSLNIAMITEFFYPRCGGVEIHILSICKELIKKGHRVIVITRYEKNICSGIHEISKDLRVYYLPLEDMTKGTVFPYFFIWIPTLRKILKKEHIDIVHFHQCTSVMMHTSVHEIELLGIRTVYTDHSIINTKETSGVAINKVFRTFSRNVHSFICVSKANAENFCDRQQTTYASEKSKQSLYIIPNGVNDDIFIHNTNTNSTISETIFNSIPSLQLSYPMQKPIVISVLSRLVSRKGIHLLLPVISEIIKDYPNVHFIIAGGGEQEDLLQQLLPQWNQDSTRVLYLGEIPHDQVPSFLSCSDIFLSCSLTESFNITLLEAFVAGCILVSTNVGGVPELFPPDYILLTPPTICDIVTTIKQAIVIAQKNPVSHPRIVNKQDKQLLEIYNWSNITDRLLMIYKETMKKECISISKMAEGNWKEGIVFDNSTSS